MACKNAAKALGLQPGGDGEEFSGNYPVKGCHAYKYGQRAGMIFYGTNGTDAEMKENPPFPNQYRPNTIDCSMKGKSIYAQRTHFSHPSLKFFLKCLVNLERAIYPLV